MKFFDEMSEAWNKAKTDDARPMECPLDYFGEGYLAAQLKQKAEIERLEVGTINLTVQLNEARKEIERLTAELKDAKEYKAKNPLGGPAAMFDTIADRIRSGEPIEQVMDDYNLGFVAALSKPLVTD